MDEDKTPHDDHEAEPPSEKDFGPSPGQMELPGKQLHKSSPSFKPSKRSTKKLIQGVLALAIILAVSSAGYFGWSLLSDSKGSTEPEQAQEQTQQTPESPLSESYTSGDLRLDFKYPEGWNVTEGAGGIRVESPEFSYQTNDGSAQGYFRVYIRQGARDVDSKYIGSGQTIAPSQKIDYTDPVPGQRKDTYLSVFGQGESASFNFFLVQGNFKLKQGDTLGPDFGTEPDAYIIAGGYSSEDNSEDLQMSSVPAGSYADDNAFKQAVEIIKSLQLR